MPKSQGAEAGFRMTRSVVTGGAGFIGRRLAGKLAAMGVAVDAWTRSTVDLLDADAVKLRLADGPPPLIIHLASGAVAPQGDRSWRCIANEVAMVANLISAAPPGTRLLVAGSMAEYGRSGRLAENIACNPRAAYGIAKLAASLYALGPGRDAGLDVCVARLFGVYGPGEAEHRLLPSLRRGLAAGVPIPLSDGEQRRDFVHVDDVCDTLVAILRLSDWSFGVVNVGTGHALSVRTVAERLADEIGAERKLLRFGEVPRRETDEDLLEADTDRLERLIGSAPPQRLVSSSHAGIATQCAD
jgi:nucleoside-diphosphate-sugar epimerase